MPGKIAFFVYYSNFMLLFFHLIPRVDMFSGTITEGTYIFGLFFVKWNDRYIFVSFIVLWNGLLRSEESLEIVL